MVNISVALLIAGMIFLLGEAFAAGFGIFGAAGLLCIIASGVITVLYIPFGIYIVLCEMVIVFIILYLIINYIKKHQLYGKIILTETLGVDKKDIGELHFFIGKEGLTKTPLKPVGTADFNGIKVEVFSDSGFIKANRRVKVCNVSDNKIYVVEITQ